jgi:hypothetical protein
MRPTKWWFNLGVDWNSLVMLSGHRKLYACADGCLIIWPDHVIEFRRNTLIDDREIESM